ncbi:GNAT family N-acetyltransferase [Paenibacillus solisilvae]|uniref:GNAT family N-acetyltransferase n=1 Tax=Paenibacillus solisilvae TaxID=2486751 RepID=A0ABW0VU56_9BACL
MDYIRIQSISDPLFKSMHQLMQNVFPPEEVYAFEKWEGPLADSGIHVYAAVHEGDVLGATEYRYYPSMKVAMTDFTIVGRAGLGVGRFILKSRERDIARLAHESGTEVRGMFAEIYNPLNVDYHFGGVTPMNPYVRREVLSHIGYLRLDLAYVHPSWEEDGKAVRGLDLCFLPMDDTCLELEASLVVDFLKEYYSALQGKPAEWLDMIQELEQKETVALQAI